jgi:hypothetical protein
MLTSAYDGPHFGHPSKILPPFVKSRADLEIVEQSYKDPTTGDQKTVTRRDLWKRVAIKFFENDENKPVDYEISDEMILDYSEQFENMRQTFLEGAKKLRTWHQLAVKHGMIKTKRAVPPPEAPYFVIEWCLSPLHHGPVEDACGCGCGCGCG